MSQRVVLYVARTRRGAKVEHREYGGLADGFFVKGYTHYRYTEDALADALDYAERKADEYDDYEVRLSPQLQRELGDERDGADDAGGEQT
jgi:hypothetical protein